MGCWNATCGLSNLPILSGEAVYVFPIIDARVDTYRSFCYAEALFLPVRTPFLAEYDDYGGGENCSGIFLEPLIDAIRQSLIEQEQGENQYHDIAVKRDGFDIDTFFKTVHKHRLQIKYHGRPAFMYFTMIRKDVIDRLWTDYPLELFHNFGTDKEPNYKRVTTTYAKLYEELPQYMDDCLSDYDENLQFFKPIFRKNTSLLKDVIFDDGNITNHSSLNLIQLKDLLIKTYPVDKAAAVEMMRTFLVATMVNGMMSEIRRIWTPVMHQGSQNELHDMYMLMNNITSDIIAERKREYEAECGDDIDDGEDQVNG